MRSRVTAVYVSVLMASLFATAASAQDSQYYVLDSFGGVHAGGGAPVISPATPYFGFDLAIDMTLVGDDGILVLDKLGGVHLGGSLVANPPVGGTPYFFFDAARAIVHREPPPPAPTQQSIYRAGVSLGTLSPSSVGVTGIRRLEDGKYNLVFAENITSCHRVASLGRVNGYMDWGMDGPRGEVYSFLSTGPNQGRDLIVVTRDAGGTLVDTDFFVIVIC